MAGQTITNLGTGGSVLDGQSGSTTGADSNDPKWLSWSGSNYVYLPGVSGNYLSVPDAAALDITGDIDIRVYVAMDDWTPSSAQILLSKWGTASTNFSYRLGINTDGRPYFQWSVTGAAALTSFSTVAPTITDGSALWIRVTLDVDNGAVGNTTTFYTSSDGSTWTALGTTVTTAGVTSIYSGAAALLLGAGDSSGTTANTAGKIYRAQVYAGISGTKVLDVDTSSVTAGSATSFTALTAQTVTVARSATGRKSVAVTAPCWLFGTDDYMTVADNDLLDFDASSSCTIVTVVRQWANTSVQSLTGKKAGSAAEAGWMLFTESGEHKIRVADATNTQTATGTATTATVQVVSGVINRSAQTATVYVNGTAGSSTSTSAVGSLVNTNATTVGVLSGFFYIDGELLATAVFRRALSATEISSIGTYYTSRWP